MRQRCRLCDSTAVAQQQRCRLIDSAVA
jgi:hypothetical protein